MSSPALRIVTNIIIAVLSPLYFSIYPNLAILLSFGGTIRQSVRSLHQWRKEFATFNAIFMSHFINDFSPFCKYHFRCTASGYIISPSSHQWIHNVYFTISVPHRSTVYMLMLAFVGNGNVTLMSLTLYHRVKQSLHYKTVQLTAIAYNGPGGRIHLLIMCRAV